MKNQLLFVCALFVCALTMSTKTNAQRTAILITSPGGGSYNVGDTLHVKWVTMPGITRPIQIGLRDWRYDPNLASGEETIIASMPNTGSYDWVIPAHLGMLSYPHSTLGCDTPVYQIALYLGVGGSDSFQLSTGFIINPSHTTTEISIPEENESTVAYPNPATEVVTVRSSSKTFSARIINMAGQVVRERNGSNSITEFQVKDLQNGNYIIEINDGSKMEHKRFLKQ